MAVLLTVLTACAPGPPSDPTVSAGLELEPFVFRADDGSEVSAERGRLRVPEHHRRSDPGGTITLGFVRFRSTASDPGPPIVYLAGGPGSSGIAAARGRRFEVFMALRAAADVIALDQRGVGASVPRLQSSMTWDLPLDQPLTAETLAQALAHMHDRARAAAAGVEGQGIDLSAYNTLASADDIDALRRALTRMGAHVLSQKHGPAKD